VEYESQGPSRVSSLGASDLSQESHALSLELNSRVIEVETRLAQLVKALATPMHVHSCAQEVQVQFLRAGQLDSGFHPSAVGKIRSNKYVVVDYCRKLRS